MKLKYLIQEKTCKNQKGKNMIDKGIVKVVLICGTALVSVVIVTDTIDTIGEKVSNRICETIERSVDRYSKAIERASIKKFSASQKTSKNS